jgi:arsenate reductase (glutaredoxin)
VPASDDEEDTVVASGQPTLYHNPRCSKSRGARALLDEAGVSYDVVEYLSAPPDRSTLDHLVAILVDPPSALVRTGDAAFRELEIERSALDDPDVVVGLLVDHPALMERPVLVVGDRAVIGRPPERVHELLES